MELQGSNNTAWDGKALIVSYARPDVLRQAKIEVGTPATDGDNSHS